MLFSEIVGVSDVLLLRSAVVGTGYGGQKIRSCWQDCFASEIADFLSPLISLCDLEQPSRISARLLAWLSAGDHLYPFSKASRPALGPKQPSFQKVTRDFSGDKKDGA